MIGAGEYKYPVTIQQPATADAARNAFGRIPETDTDDWTTYITPVRARWSESGGKEVNLLKRVNADITLVLGLRSSPETRAITRRMRVRTEFGKATRYINILDVVGTQDDGGEVTLHCQENRD